MTYQRVFHPVHQIHRKAKSIGRLSPASAVELGSGHSFEVEVELELPLAVDLLIMGCHQIWVEDRQLLVSVSRNHTLMFSTCRTFQRKLLRHLSPGLSVPYQSENLAEAGRRKEASVFCICYLPYLLSSQSVRPFYDV